MTIAAGQLAFDWDAAEPQNGSDGRSAASAPTEPQDGLRALVEHVLNCSSCGGALTPGDVGATNRRAAQDADRAAGARRDRIAGSLRAREREIAERFRWEWES